MQDVVSGQYCERHGIEKTYWQKNTRNRTGGSWKCKKCAAESSRAYARKKRKEHPELNWRINRTNRGVVLTQEARTQLGNTCMLCGKPAAVVDHNHLTGEVRGVLCIACNVALGKLGDDPSGLGRAYLYVGGQPCS